MTEQSAREKRGMDIIDTCTPNGPPDNRDDIRASAVDIITDVLHALRRYGFDAESAHKMAMVHFVQEWRESHP